MTKSKSVDLTYPCSLIFTYLLWFDNNINDNFSSLDRVYKNYISPPVTKSVFIF